MSQAVDAPKVKLVPWWLVLIEGLLLIIIGIFLLTQPLSTFVTIIWVLGIYWLISGIFNIIKIFFDSSMWGWKIFAGIVGIIAGWFLIQNPIGGSVVVSATTVILLGLFGIFIGIVNLIQAFRGAGWGTGILGVISIILGIILLTNRFVFTFSLPWALGIMAIIGGIIAIFNAFRIRGAKKDLEEAAEAAQERKQQMADTAETRAQAVDLDEAAEETDGDAAKAAAVAAAAAVAVSEADEEDEEAVVDAGAVAVAAEETAAEAEEAAGEEPGVTAEDYAEAMEEAAADAEAAAEEAAEEAADDDGIGAAPVVAAAAVAASRADDEPEATADDVAEALEDAADEAAEEAAEAEEAADDAAARAAVVGAAAAVAATEAEDEPQGTADDVAEALEEASEPEVRSFNLELEEPDDELNAAVAAQFPDLAAEQHGSIAALVAAVSSLDASDAEKLTRADVGKPESLLERGASRQGRVEISNATGIDASIILKWVNDLDLKRIKGVGTKYSDLLETAGVDTTVELAQRNPANLYKKLVVVNEAEQVVESMPTEDDVVDWVAQAKELPRVITY